MELDLTNIVKFFFEYAEVVLIGFLSWASVALRNHFKIKAEMDAGVILKDAIARGMDYAESLVLGSDGKISIHMKNFFLAKAVEYVLAQVPGKMKDLDLDAENIKNMIEARINPDKFVAREPSNVEVAKTTNFNQPTVAVSPIEIPGAH